MTNPYLDLLSGEDQKAETIAPPAKNPYLATLQSVNDEEESRLQQRIAEGARTNPDQAAKAVQLSKKMEIPVDSVARNLQDVQLQDAVNTYDKKLQSSPKLLRAVRDVPNFMNQSHDDLDNLGFIEKNINEFRRNLSNTLRGFDITRAVQAIKMLGAMDEEAATPVTAEREERMAIYRRQQQMYSGLTPEKQEALRQEAGVNLRLHMQDQIASNLAEAAVRQKAVNKLPMDPALKEFQSQDELGPALSALTKSPVGIATQIVSGSLGSMLPTLPYISAGFALGGVPGMMAATGATSAATEYVNNLPDIFQKMGVDVTNADAVAEALKSPEFKEQSRKALIKAGVIGVFDAATAGFAGKTLSKTHLGNLAAQTAIQMAGGGGGEVAGSLASGQDVSASAVLSEMLGEVPGAVIDVARVSAGRALAAATKTQDAHEGHLKLQELIDLANKSKLRTRNPDTFQQFVQQMGDEEGTSHVYIDATKLQETLQQAGVTDEKFAEILPSVVPQMAEALQVGGTVSIPIGELAARLTGTGLEQELLQHMRTEPDALSHFEAEEAVAQSQVLMQQEAQKVLAEATDVQATMESADRVRETVLNQLAIGNRFRADVNTAYATFIRDFYVATSGRLGITPEEMYAKYPLRIIAESPVAGESVLSQPEGLTTRITTEPVRRSQANQEILNLVQPQGANDVSIRAEVNGQEIGHLDLAVGADGKTAEVREILVTPEQRRKGVATALYNAAIAQGYDVQRSQFQTEEGAAFRDAFDRAIGEGELMQSRVKTATPAVSKLLKNLTPAEQSKVTDKVAEKIIQQMKAFPAAKEMAAVAFAGRAKRGWYAGSAQALSAVFGADAPRFAAMLAAMSPQVSVETNLLNALNTWKNWIAAGRPSEREAIIDVMGKSVQGGKGRASVLDAWINNTVRALASDDFTKLTLSGPKVNSFFRNLVGVTEEVTNDAWMANYTLVNQTIFKGGLNVAGDEPGKGVGYLALNARVREAAKQLTKLTGEEWTPAEVQETVWSWAKALYETANAGDEPRSAMQIVEEGALTDELINATPDFSTLLYNDVYANILNEAGYGQQLADLVAGGAGQPGQQPGAAGQAAPFAAETQRQLELQAARRLDRLAASRGDARAAAAEQQFEQDIAELRDEQSTGAETFAGELSQQGRVRGSTGLLANAPGPDLGTDQPLVDLPATVKVNGQDVTFGPHAPAREAARRYAERAGLPYNPPSTYVKVDTKRAKLIADAFEAMPHDPADPAVKASYDAMIRETIAQWQAIKETGLVVEFITGDDPYGNPRNAILDVVENNHLWVYPTSAGFGGTESLGVDISGNPLLAVVPGEEISGRSVQANDVFRIVHDYFGHIKEGVGFRADGEENAWRSHWAMYSPLARQAMTTETRGQNSWVNFGPFTEFNKTAGPVETQYAPQKIGLLPSWAVEEGATDTGGVLTQASPAPTIGIHFSKQPRKALDGRYYGSGLKGLEAERLRETTDQRLKERIYVYLDEGNGVRPESGVGGFAHEVPLPALYDAKADPLGLWKSSDLNATEARILDAGFGGYFIRNAFNSQGAAVVLGPQSRGIAVAEIPVPGYTPPAPPAPAVYKRGLMSAELSALNIEQIRAVAPSATVKGGTFQVNEADLPAAQAAAAAQGVNLPGMVLTQPRGAETAPSGPRATFNPKSLTINLLKTADLSSFLHESGHFFLEVMADIASQPDAPADVTADMETVLKWFGVTDMYEWNTRTLDQKRPFHEKFAESFEQYLFEGKAPSAELQPVFSRFRSWMMTVYKSIKEIFQQSGGGLSNEVREVFDRLLATQDQINEQQRLAGYTLVYQSAEQAGMTPEEWTKYQKQDEVATATAMDALQSRTLRDLRWTINARSKELKRLQGEVDEQRKAMRNEVKAEVRQQPVYAVQRWMKTGELPDGTKSEGGKLSTKILREMFGDGPAAPWRYLATNLITADELGLHPNMVAELFGFASGDAMVRAIVNAFPEDQTIDGMTDTRLLETYGDTVTEAGMKRAAEEAIVNEARARFMATGLKAISQAQTPAKVLLKAAKLFAQNIISRRKIMDLKPSVFTGAGARAAKRLAEATAASDTQAAISAQRDQLLNHYAAAYTMDVQAEVKKALEYLRKFDKEAGRKSLPADYMEQIDTLLERFDLRTSTTLRAIEKRKSLAAWVKDQEDMGLTPVVPESLLEEARSVSYKELTVEEFRGVVDSVKNIEHLGRLKNKLLKAKDKREFAAIIAGIEQSIRDNATQSREVRVNAPTAKDRAADFARGFFSSHRKLSSLVRQLDGFKDGGPFWQVFTRTMNESGDHEATMRAKATEKLAEIFTPFLKDNKLSEMVEIPAINKSLSLETRLAVALNSGNSANKQRIMDGDKWSEHQLNAVLSTLTPEQLKFVQKVWDHIDTYWPDVKAKEERISGLAPEKVAAEPLLVTAKGGEMVQLAGGYYPIKYDPDRSSRAEADTAAELTKQMLQGQYTRATTRRGHTKARAETVNRAVRKDIGVVFQHVDQVIHDLAWHEWLIDANRLVRSSPIESAIRETVGPEVLREFKKAIEDIAAGDVPAQSEFERGINHLRQGATIVGLGWNTMTSLMQPMGLTQSMVRIGPRWVGKGLARWIGDATRMEGGVKDVYEKSEFMKLRGQTINREINEIRNKVQGAKLTAVEETYFYLIQKLQIVADMPTWLGQYEKAYATSGITDPKELEAEAIAQADQAVRDAQGSGMTGDLARVQRGGPLQKLFTSFYSYFSTTYNLTAERYNMTKFSNPLQAGRFAVDMLLLYSVPSVLTTLMKEALTGKGDDEDKLAEKLIRDQLSYLLGAMVGLREAGAAVSGFSGYQGPAGTRFFSELAKLAKQTEQGEIDKGMLKALDNVGGMLFHYPAGQVNRTVEGFLALKEGETANPLALLFGPPR